MYRTTTHRVLTYILILPGLSWGAPPIVDTALPIQSGARSSHVPAQGPDSVGASHALTPAAQKQAVWESGFPQEQIASIGCGPACDFCWFGGPFELDCDPAWEDDGSCDCGCQFPDTFDCNLPQCEPQCQWCHLGTTNENNCPTSWIGDGECDCGCQFSDTADCFGGGTSDLIIQDDVPSAADHTNPEYSIGVTSTTINQGTGPANAAFDMTWFISLDANLSPTQDLPWAFVTIDCCLPTSVAFNASGAVPWPDFAPFNTPGVTYYFSVMADDTLQVPESNELNNWGRLWQLTLCDSTGDLSGDFQTTTDDYVRLAACLVGPGGTKPTLCLCADDDNDTDVDLLDVATFLNAFDGL